MNVKGHIIIIFFILSFYACKKDKKDTTPPVISMNTPLEGAQYNMFDTIPLSASVSDETNLTRAEITLRDANGILVQNSVLINLSGTSYSLNVGLELYEFRLPTGNYIIEIVVSDGENICTKSTRINITESPYVHKGFYFVSKNGTQHTYTKTAADYSIQSSLNLGGSFVGSALTSYYQTLYAAASPNQNLKAIDISNHNTRWSLSNSSTGATVTACNTDGKNLFYGKDDGNVYKFNQDGVALKTYFSGELTWYVKSLFCCGDYVVVSLFDFNSTGKKTVVFETSSGIVKKVIQNTELKAAYVKSAGQLYLVSNNQQGKAVVEILTVSGGSVIEMLDMGSVSITGACQVDSEVLLVATSDGKVYYYKYSAGSVVVLTGMPVQKLNYSEKFNTVYLSSYKDFYTYGVSTFALTPLFLYGHTDTILDFQVILNK